MPPFIGVDDIFEFTLADIILAIGADVISELTGTVAVASAEVGNLFKSLVGSEGINVIMDLVKIGGGEEVASNISSIDQMGGMILKTIEEEGMILWEEEAPKISQKVPDNIFISKFKELASALLKQGIDLKDLDGLELLKTIAKKALQMGKDGVKKIANPKLIGGAVLGALGTNALYRKLKRKAEREYRKVTPKVSGDQEVSEIERF